MLKKACGVQTSTNLPSIPSFHNITTTLTEGAKTKDESGSCVCVVLLSSMKSLNRFIAAYNGNNWIDKTGEYLQTKCKIVKLSTNLKKACDRYVFLLHNFKS